ncbi:MAG: restriction endonuclease subunit S [Leptospirales bacterium]|nr:restriction endonuclease subunit S [Leptospirales bacterium]
MTALVTAPRKESGIEWLGELPKGWEVKRLKYAASINDEALPETTDPDFEMVYVDIGSVDYVAGIRKTETLTFENAPSRARRIARNGDTIVSTVRTYLRAIADIRGASENLIVSTGFAVVRPKHVDPGYLGYALRESGFVETVVARSVGVSYPAVNASDVASIPIPLPPLPQQRAIASFLDRETARIDALIGKKERQIELLQEKRTVLISHAVTKGLDPNAKMKDSGIEWLGEMPEGWEVKRFSHLARVVRGASPRPAGDSRFFFGDHVPWITVADITKDESTLLTDTESMLTAEGMEYSRFMPAGTLVLTNSGATLGVPKILGLGGCANDGVVAFLNIDRGASIEFLFYYLASLTRTFREMIRQGSGQPNLNTEIVKATWVPLPPLVEQMKIVAHVKTGASRVHALGSKVRQSIDLLREYRTAVISAAVTGKIDVREEVA